MAVASVAEQLHRRSCRPEDADFRWLVPERSSWRKKRYQRQAQVYRRGVRKGVWRETSVDPMTIDLFYCLIMLCGRFAIIAFLGVHRLSF